MFFKKQLCYIDVATLDCIHKRGDATLVFAVWFILAPRVKIHNNRIENIHHVTADGQADTWSSACRLCVLQMIWGSSLLCHHPSFRTKL